MQKYKRTLLTMLFEKHYSRNLKSALFVQVAKSTVIYITLQVLIYNLLQYNVQIDKNFIHNLQYNKIQVGSN